MREPTPDRFGGRGARCAVLAHPDGPGGEEVRDRVHAPLLYARENVGGVISLVQAVREFGVACIVFSSSCSVYGTRDLDRVCEDAPAAPESVVWDRRRHSVIALAKGALPACCERRLRPLVGQAFQPVGDVVGGRGVRLAGPHASGWLDPKVVAAGDNYAWRA